jgi:hypothetical protein
MPLARAWARQPALRSLTSCPRPTPRFAALTFKERTGVTAPVDVTIAFRDARLAAMWDRFKAGERMTLADGVAMLETEDVLALGRMADLPHGPPR